MAAPFSEENEFYIRLVLLVKEKGAEAQRECLLHFSTLQYGVRTFDDVLHHVDAKRILQGLKGRPITNKQWLILYPGTGVPVTVNQLDITLCFVLLRNICGLTPPTTTWDKPPAPTDSSVEGGLAQIKYIRNCISHSSDPSLSEAEFSSYFKDTSNALLNKGKKVPTWPITKTELDKYQRCPINSALYKELLNVVKMWSQQDSDIKTEVHNLGIQMSKMERNITKQIDLKLEGHERQMNKHLENKLTVLKRELSGNVKGKTEDTSTPGKPSCREVEFQMLLVVWSPPSRKEHQIIAYLIYDTIKGLVGRVDGDVNDFKFTPELNTEYQIVVRADYDIKGPSQPSEPSDPVTVVLTQEKIRQNISRLATKCPKQWAEEQLVYQLDLKFMETSNRLIKKAEFGTQSHKPEKVIILLGATGSGKTTLINAMVNYILGVEWEDDFRVRLVPEEENAANQCLAQTTDVTAYTLHHQPWFKIPYTLTIVDTPGFGYTSGVDRDIEITKQIGTFFRTGCIPNYINAIGFVLQSPLARLTVTEQYILNSMLALFGKDLSDTVVPLLTSAGGGRPKVLWVLKKAKVSFKEYYKFDSCAFFREQDYGDDDDDDDDDFDQSWNISTNSFREFLQAVQTMPNKSLQLTKQLLTERETLQLQIEGINKDINTGVTKLHQLDQELDIMKEYDAEIRRNKNFTYTVEEEQVERKMIPVGTYTTICLACNRTCHYPCDKYGEDKIKCSAMRNGNCTVCPGKCVWSVHKSLPYTYDVKMVKVTKTAEDLKKRYQTAQREYMTTEKVVNRLMADFEQTHKEVILRSIETKRCINRIKEIALKPHPLSMSEYVDLLIEEEKKIYGGEDGYLQRINPLTEVRKTAEILEQLTEEEGYDPFSDLADMITKVKERYDF